MAALTEVDSLINEVIPKKAKGIGTGQGGCVDSGGVSIDSEMKNDENNDNSEIQKIYTSVSMHF